MEEKAEVTESKRFNMLALLGERPDRETFRAGGFIDKKGKVLDAIRADLEDRAASDEEFNNKLLDCELGFGCEGDERYLLPFLFELSHSKGKDDTLKSLTSAVEVATVHIRKLNAEIAELKAAQQQ